MSSKSQVSSGTSESTKNVACMDPAVRCQRIAELAYYKAEARGFSGDRALDDWLDAESEVDDQYSTHSTPKSH